MKEEYAALMRNNTKTLIPYQSYMNVVDNKWVFRFKYNLDGTIQRY